MKKMLILVSVIAMSVAACGKKQPATTPTPATETAPAEEPVENTEAPAEEAPAEGGDESTEGME